MLTRLRRRVLCLVTAGVITVVPSQLHAQGVPTSVDPFVVQSEIADNPDFDVASLWRSLKIPAQLDTVYAKVGTPPLASATLPFDRCSNTCRAEISLGNVDTDGAIETILVIYQESKFCRFLVFKETPTASNARQWRFVGHADHDALGQYDPEYRVSSMGGRPYFVIQASGMHETGMRLRYERWYEVGSGGMREVLSLPTDGLECRDARSLCRAFGSTVVAARTSPRGEELVASFTVNYWGDESLLDGSRASEIPLFGRIQRAVFVRPLKSSESYVLAPLDSEIATWELDAIFRLEALTCKDFLAANADNLARIATSPGSDARRWLARYVDQCSPSEQRTELLKLLTK